MQCKSRHVLISRLYGQLHMSCRSE